MERRLFLAGLAALGFSSRFRASASQIVAVHYRKPNPYESQLLTIDAHADIFECEKRAIIIERANAARAEGRFYSLPGDLVRYEVKAPGAYRVGTLRQKWNGDRLLESKTVAESAVHSAEPYFRDVTGHVFGDCESFQNQLAIGNPEWRAALDPALGIDIYASNGISVADIDNCGRDEIYVCQQGGLPNRLYKFRDGDRLEDITARAGLDILDDTTCALFADFRNSGHQDLVILRGAGPLLFLNDGAGRFKHAPDAFRFQTPPQGSFTGMSAADYDRNGKLDLYLCCYVYFQSEDQYRYPAPYHDAQNGPPNFLFRNDLNANGNGVFTDVTESSGMNHNNNRYSFAPAWCDFDNDGWPDLYVANDFGRNNLYRNRNGHFRDQAAELGVEDMGPGMSASWFDYDGDGNVDLYISNMWSAPGQRITRDPAFPQALPAGAYQRHAKGNTLFRYNGRDRFEETSAAENVEMGRWAWSSGGFDFNNDGRPEIFITAGMLSAGGPDQSPDLNSFFWRQVVSKSGPGAEPSPAYEDGWNAINQVIREGKNWCGGDANVFYARPPGASSFEDHSGISGLDFAGDSRAFAVTDVDGDGNLDIVLKSRLGPQVRVLQNNCTQGRPSIGIKLIGTRSNRDAIGARIELNGQVKFVDAGSGYLSQHSKTIYFALGAQDRADVRITWPSGLVQFCKGLGIGIHQITEDAVKTEMRPFTKPSPWPNPPVEVSHAAASAPTWFLDPVPLPERRSAGFLVLHAGNAPAFPVGLPVEKVDLSRDSELAAAYSIFRRYLFDVRADLALPTLLLVDEQSRARRFYPVIPDEAMLQADLTSAAKPLPFPGRFHTEAARNYYKLGAAFYQAGYPGRAIPYLLETTRRNPDNVKAWMAVGELRAETGDPEQALEAFERVLQIQPDRVSAHQGAGDAANQLGLRAARNNDAATAKRYFEQAVSFCRDHSTAINNLAVLYMKQGQAGDAIAALQYGIQVAPDDEQLYMNLGRIYVSSGDRDKARRVMEQLLDRKPNDATALRALAELNSR